MISWCQNQLCSSVLSAASPMSYSSPKVILGQGFSLLPASYPLPLTSTSQQFHDAVFSLSSFVFLVFYSQNICVDDEFGHSFHLINLWWSPIVYRAKLELLGLALRLPSHLSGNLLLFLTQMSDPNVILCRTPSMSMQSMLCKPRNHINILFLSRHLAVWLSL